MDRPYERPLVGWREVLGGVAGGQGLVMSVFSRYLRRPCQTVTWFERCRRMGARHTKAVIARGFK